MIVCALSTTSCLMPQSVDPIVDTPHPPPHFVLESIPTYLLPPVLQLVRQGSADAAAVPPCHCTLELSIPLVEEDDPTVTLEARWFVDYDTTVPSSVRAWATERLDGDFNNPGTIRSLKPFSFDADSLGIATNGFHRVDVVVAETAGYDPTSTTRPNRGMNPGYTPAEYSFFVNVKVDQVAGNCPTELPSVKVCQ